MSFNLNTASAACPVSCMTELKEFLMGHVGPLKVVMARAFFGLWCYFWSLLKAKLGVYVLSIDFKRGTGCSKFSQKEGGEH